MERVDVLVVGGGPAGLSAAVWLGRCRRRVVVYDAGEPRNARSTGVHGFLTRDGIGAAELRALARAEVVRYGGEVRDGEVVDARPAPDGWVATLRSGSELGCRKLLLATGLRDVVPDIEGLDALYGRSVVHCPFCDGYEARDQPLAVIGSGPEGAGLALTLKGWSADVHLFTHGPTRLDRRRRGLLAANDVRVTARRIHRLEPDGDGCVLVSGRGERERRRAVFLAFGTVQRSSLPVRLGCRLDRRGAVYTNQHQEVGVPHLFVAGDAAKDVHLAVVAAAEGARAAHRIQAELIRDDQRRAHA